jgi:hypothetical protein
MHYAMLDAYVLTEIVERIDQNQKGKKLALTLKGMQQVMDNSCIINTCQMKNVIM